jgi:peptide/nickel transport system substrate-binding protein
MKCTCLRVIAFAMLLVSAPAWGQAEPRRTLVVGMGSVVRHLNPAVQAAPVNTVGVQIFAGLVRFDSGWEPQPYLAESWTWQDDGKSLLVRLVKGATFHDGRPITSEDVAFSIMAVKASHPFNTMLAPVERVDTPSPQLAIIRLRQEHPALLLALAPALCPIMPKHVYGEGQELRSHPRNADPVGSGPFRVTAFEPGRHVTLERHRGFFLKDRLRLDGLIYRVIPDPSVQVLEIEKGDVQMLVGPVTVSQAGQLAKSPKVSIVARGGEAIGPVGWLEMNLRRKPYDDPRVRRAIAYAIDKDFIVRTLHRGATQAATGPIAPGSPFHFGKVEAYKHDLAKANRLLDEAGLARNAQGVRFAMTLDYQPGIPDQLPVDRGVPAAAAQESRDRRHDPRLAGFSHLGEAGVELGARRDHERLLHVGRPGDWRAPDLGLEQHPPRRDLLQHAGLLELEGGRTARARRGRTEPGAPQGAVCGLPEAPRGRRAGRVHAHLGEALRRAR